MENCAIRFDAPPLSDFHVVLRDTAWMGGSLVEGRYLLGMMLGTNLFRVELEAYLQTLHTYISTTISEQAAAVFCNESSLDALIPYLRLQYERRTDLPRLASPHERGPPRNERLELGIEYLLHHLHASSLEIANHLGTTEKQVMRMTILKWGLDFASRYIAESAPRSDKQG